MIDASGQGQPLHAAQLIELGALKISCERDGDVRAICLSGELDLATADRVQRELERAEASDARSILLDLSGLTFMDSTGVRLLLSAHARSRADSGRLTMLRGSPAVQRVLQLTGVADRLPFVDVAGPPAVIDPTPAADVAHHQDEPLTATDAAVFVGSDSGVDPPLPMAPSDQSVGAQLLRMRPDRARREGVQRRVSQAALAVAIRSLASPRRTEQQRPGSQ
jgi:anti-sigma B factor antagonist